MPCFGLLVKTGGFVYFIPFSFGLLKEKLVMLKNFQDFFELDPAIKKLISVDKPLHVIFTGSHIAAASGPGGG